MKKIIFILAACFATAIAYAESIQDLQKIDGETRNRLSDIFGSGGGGSGGAATTTVNTWTNQIFSPSLTITNFGNGASIVGNAAAGATYTELNVFSPTDAGTPTLFQIASVNSGAGLVTVSAGPRTAPVAVMQLTGSTALTLGGGVASVGLTPSGSGTALIGDSSGDTATFNVATATTPNKLNINSGVLILPPDSVGTITNSTSFTSLGTIQGTNIVATTPNLYSTITTGSATNLDIIVNGGASPLRTKALFVSTTNTISAALPVVNAIYTNDTTRLYVNTSFVMGANSGVALWTVLGNNTNFQSTVGSSIASTNSVDGVVPPTALYMFTNFLGTTTIIQGRHNENRF